MLSTQTTLLLAFGTLISITPAQGAEKCAENQVYYGYFETGCVMTNGGLRTVVQRGNYILGELLKPKGDTKPDPATVEKYVKQANDLLQKTHLEEVKQKELAEFRQNMRAVQNKYNVSLPATGIAGGLDTSASKCLENEKAIDAFGDGCVQLYKVEDSINHGINVMQNEVASLKTFVGGLREPKATERQVAMRYQVMAETFLKNHTNLFHDDQQRVSYVNALHDLVTAFKLDDSTKGGEGGRTTSSSAHMNP